MDMRWSVVLPVAHIVIALMVIVPDETMEWRVHRVVDGQRFYEIQDEAARLDRRQRRAIQHRFFDEEPTEEQKRWEASVMYEYQASNATRAMCIINLPAFLLVGWYEHPVWFSSSAPRLSTPLLWPILSVAGDTMHLRMRIMVLDLLFLAIIGLQWWMIGGFFDLRHKRKYAPLFRSLLQIITYAGVFCAVLSPIMRTGQWIDALVILAVLPAFFAWMAVAALMVCVFCNSVLVKQTDGG